MEKGTTTKKAHVILDQDVNGIHILPGDEIKLANGDVIVWLTGPEAQAYLLLRKEAVRRTNETIEHVRSQNNGH